MLEDFLRLALSFGVQTVVIMFWYYIMSRTGSF